MSHPYLSTCLPVLNSFWSVRVVAALAIGFVSLPTIRAQNQCSLSVAFDQPNANASGGKTPVRWTADRKALLFVSSLNVNTDGSARSYSVEDFWGETKAINNLCNAMSDACAGMDASQLRQRRILTQNASKEGWPQNALQSTKISRNIIPFDTTGKPCTTPEGYLVSATSLVNLGVTDKCDLKRYVDALKVAALVLPKGPQGGTASGFASNNAQVGDLAAVWIPGSEKVFFAVVGDTGPSGKLGEASVGLNGRLLGKTAPPENRLQLMGRQAPHIGKGWNVPNAAVVIFPGSRNPSQPWASQDRIDTAARTIFDQVGGLSTFSNCTK